VRYSFGWERVWRGFSCRSRHTVDVDLEAVMLASTARSMHVWTLRLVGWLHLRPVMRWTMHRTPGRVRVATTRMLLRVGYHRPVTFVPADDLQRCLREALSLLPAGPLTYLEFGVYVGTSMIAMHHAARAEDRNVEIIGFDSFAGLPPNTREETKGVFHPGQFHSAIDMTRTNLRRHDVDPDRVRLVPGWFEESLTAETQQSLGVDHVDLVMIDCDLESSTRLALEFCTPLIGRTVVFFDDWDINGWGALGLGEARAFETWRSAHPEFDIEERPELRYRDRDRARAFLITRNAVDGTSGSTR
jgi:predicted O-methyltransferase YrrM